MATRSNKRRVVKRTFTRSQIRNRTNPASKSSSSSSQSSSSSSSRSSGGGGSSSQQSVVSAGLSTAEKLASANPAVRAEGQRELSAQQGEQREQTVSRAKEISSSVASGTVAAEQIRDEGRVAVQVTGQETAGDIVRQSREVAARTGLREQEVIRQLSQQSELARLRRQEIQRQQETFDGGLSLASGGVGVVDISKEKARELGKEAGRRFADQPKQKIKRFQKAVTSPSLILPSFTPRGFRARKELVQSTFIVQDVPAQLLGVPQATEKVLNKLSKKQRESFASFTLKPSEKVSSGAISAVDGSKQTVRSKNGKPVQGILKKASKLKNISDFVGASVAKEAVKQASFAAQKPLTTAAFTVATAGAGTAVRAGAGKVTKFIPKKISKKISSSRIAKGLTFGGVSTAVTIPSVKEETSVAGKVGAAVSAPVLIGVEFGAVAAKNVATRLSPKYRGVKTLATGEKVVPRVKKTSGETIEIGLVPAGAAKDLDVNVTKLLKEQTQNIPLKQDLTLPKVKGDKAKALKVAKEEGAVISGSFAQRAQVEGRRKIKDLDIISTEPEQTARKIAKEVGGRVVKQKVSFTVLKGDKEIADVVSLDVGEEGLAKEFSFVDVEGLKLVDIRARLGSKVKQAAEKGKVKPKVFKDISLLTGGSLDLSEAQTVRGGFGFSFAEQAKFAGTTGDVITAQRSLFGTFEDVKRIDKPPTTTEPLEKSLFASPFDPATGRPQLRVSRLGVIDKEAGLGDIFSGDFQLFSGKPQAILFEDQKIADFPPSLKGLVERGKKGDKAAISELKRLYTKEQQRPTGEFKPLGFVGSSEAELTLPRGEIIRKKGVIAKTIIEGKPVSVISAEVVSPAERIKLSKSLSKETLQDFRSFAAQPTSKQRAKRIEKRIAKESGIKLDLASSVRTKPVFPKRKFAETVRASSLLTRPKRKIANGFLSRPVSPTRRAPRSQPFPRSPTLGTSQPTFFRPSPSTSAPSGTTSGFTYTPTSTGTSGLSYTPPSTPTGTSTTTSTTTKTTTTTTKRGRFEFERKQQTKDQAYRVEVKEKGKWVKVNKQKLNKQAALSLGADLTDNSSAATFRITKVKGQPSNKSGSYWALNQDKFRSFRKKRKQKVNLKGQKTETYIEKNKSRIDTRGEFEGITLKGLLAQRRKRERGFRL